MSVDDRLAAAVEEIAREVGGTVAVAARNLGTGMALDRLADERFPSASVIKIAILLELLARADEGDLRLTDRLIVQDEDKVPGSGVLSMLGAGLELSLDDLAHLMMNVSDNTASNLLIGRLGCDAINRRLSELGLTSTRLERKFYDFAAREKGLDNWVAAGELADLLMAVERRSVLSPAACEKALAVMRKQQFTSRIPALLPPDTPVANKTGSITGICHDAGIIYSPAGPLVLVVLTRDLPHPAVAEGAIRHVARMVYEQWGQPRDQAL